VRPAEAAAKAEMAAEALLKKVRREFSAIFISPRRVGW